MNLDHSKRIVMYFAVKLDDLTLFPGHKRDANCQIFEPNVSHDRKAYDFWKLLTGTKVSNFMKKSLKRAQVAVSKKSFLGESSRKKIFA